MKHDFYYPSRDGMTQIHAVEWKPEGEVKAVLQICHGMVEYIERYGGFAKMLALHGYYVVGHDHLGHGKSIQSEAEFGYFGEKYGNQFVIGDIHRLREMTAEKYPDVPYFIMGHSMGSFLTRQYIQMYGKGLSGAILMGTGYKPGWMLAAGKCLCRVIAVFKGWHYRSRTINNMAFGSYNRKFQPAKTDVDWVTSDPEMLNQYVNDPLCGFVFTINAYYQMFTGMQELTKKDSIKKIPRDLPVFFVAGEDDPVGNFGKHVKKVYEEYKASGIRDVSIKLYKGDRHEILNETDRKQVYQDLYAWMEGKIEE